jgi:hypothetical protein
MMISTKIGTQSPMANNTDIKECKPRVANRNKVKVIVGFVFCSTKDWEVAKCKCKQSHSYNQFLKKTV